MLLRTCKCYLCYLLLLVLIDFGGTRKKPYSYQFVHREFYGPPPYYGFDFEHPEDNFEHEVGSRWLCLMFGICGHTFFPPEVTGQKTLKTVYEWSQLEFDYEGEGSLQSDLITKFYIPGAPAPIDVDVYYGPNNDNKVFVAIPRFQAGVPVALGTLTDKVINGNPVIAPYPSWRWHRNPKLCSSDRIVSVYRIQIDECGRLWVLDTGRLEEEQVCPPQILAFDLRTNEILHRYEIPSDQLEPRSILVTPVVDVRDPQGRCKDTFVYVADCQTFSIIVYDVRKHTSWRVSDKTMYPYPTSGTFDIEGENFDLMDGVLGMALSPYYPGEDRKLYFHAMSSRTENWVYTSDLRNSTRFQHDPSSSPEIFHAYDGLRSSQSAAEAIDTNGIAYFGTMHDTAINCWDTTSEYGPHSIDTIAEDPVRLQFASGVKIINNRKGQQELWTFTVRFQKIAVGTLSTSETNFRILAGKTEDLLAGTKCKGSVPSHLHNGVGYSYGHKNVHG